MADRGTDGVPDWKDASAGGGLVRAAAWLLHEVGQGNTFTKGQLRADFPDISQIDRRVRDLRGYGWVINTSREDTSLTPVEQRFVTRGLDVWDPEQRKRAAAVSPPRHRVGGAVAGADAVEDLAAIAGLAPRERAQLLGWIAMGERPRTAVEQLWEQYLSLPAQGRQQLTRALAKQVDRDLPVAETASAT
ncbi:hypothetical protein [Streptomyces sp. NPDC048332]|uniref:hypothetical protein n=1 Tax=Streptomyces sp. NPDC048332 TaxID=3154619 RepID=UPI00342DABD0